MNELLDDMRTLTILCSSLSLFLIGVVIEDRGFVMELGDGGEALYPLSSGSEGGLLMKAGLYPFIVASLSAAVSIVAGGTGRVTLGIFIACSVIYGLMAALVSMDANLVESAKLGDWHPLAANTLWLASLGIVMWLSFNKKMHGDKRVI